MRNQRTWIEENDKGISGLEDHELEKGIEAYMECFGGKLFK